MSIPNQQIGWDERTKLYYQIAKQMERLIQVASKMVQLNSSSIVSATVDDTAPNKVVLTFSNANALVTSDFSVVGFIVSSGLQVGSVFTLTLSTSAIYSSALTVSWKENIKPIINNIFDRSNFVGNNTATRSRISDGNFYIDIVLSSLGFAGDEYIDWEVFMEIIGNGLGVFRQRASKGNYYIEETLTATGFAGIENTDWENKFTNLI